MANGISRSSSLLPLQTVTRTAPTQPSAAPLAAPKTSSVPVKASPSQLQRTSQTENLRQLTSPEVLSRIGQGVSRLSPTQLQENADVHLDLAQQLMPQLRSSTASTSAPVKAVYALGQDNAVQGSAASLVKKVNADGQQEHTAMDFAGLGSLTSQDKLTIVGHGNAETFAGMKPDELAAHLASAGVKELGKISLKGCNSAPFAQKLFTALEARGIQVERISGREDQVVVTQSGRALVRGAEGEFLHKAEKSKLEISKQQSQPLYAGRLPSAVATESQALLAEGHSGVLILNAIANLQPSNDIVQFMDRVQAHGVQIQHTNPSAQALLIGLGEKLRDDIPGQFAQACALFANEPNPNMTVYYALNQLEIAGQISPNELRAVKWSMGMEMPPPGAATLGDLSINTQGRLQGRPGFDVTTLTGVPIGAGEARRHIMAWHTMRDTINGALNNGMTVQEVVGELTVGLNAGQHPLRDDVLQRGLDMANAAYPHANNETRQLLALMYTMNSNPDNLWPGSSQVNSTINAVSGAVHNALMGCQNEQELRDLVNGWDAPMGHPTIMEATQDRVQTVVLGRLNNNPPATYQEARRAACAEVLAQYESDRGVHDANNPHRPDEHNQFVQMGETLYMWKVDGQPPNDSPAALNTLRHMLVYP